MTVVYGRDQRELRARREGKDRNTLGCILTRSGEIIHVLSLIRE
jgi:hypothetical protein